MSAEPAKPASSHWLVWVFAIVGLIGVLAFIGLVLLVSSPYEDIPEAKVAERAGGEVYSVGDAQELRGTNLIQLVVSASEDRGGSYSYSREDRRNIVLVDKATGQTRRLLPNNRRKIGNITYLSARGDLLDGQPLELGPSGSEGLGEDTKAAPYAYFVLEVRHQGDDRLWDVLIGTLADGRQAFVLSGVDGVDSIWRLSPDRIGMLVREKLALYYRIVDVPTLRVVHSRRIEIG